MKGKELERKLVVYSDRSASDLDVRGRKLREVGMLPTAGRGPYAPDLDSGHVATVLIAAAGAQLATDAIEAVKTYAPMKVVGGKAEGFVSEDTFREALVAALSNPKLAGAVERVAFCLSPATDHRFPFAQIFFRQSGKSRIATYAPDDRVNGLTVSDSLALGGGSMTDWCIIGGGLVAQLALELSEVTESGWVGAAGYTTAKNIKVRGAAIAKAGRK